MTNNYIATHNVICTCVRTQEIPSIEEVPSLLHPTSSKLDPEHLLRDLPKYKPWISAQSWEKWDTFIHQIDQLDTLQEIP